MMDFFPIDFFYSVITCECLLCPRYGAKLGNTKIYSMISSMVSCLQTQPHHVPGMA